jgi:hypothetical protein
MTVDPPPQYAAWGASVYSPDGEPYIQLPRSLMGTLPRRVQIVLNALSEIMGDRSMTNVRDRDIMDRTGLSRRAVQRALHYLQHRLQFIDRVREGARRIISLIKGLLARRPKPQPDRPAPAAPKTPKPAPAGGNQPPSYWARIAIDSMAVSGLEPRVVDDRLTWVPIPGAERKGPSDDVLRMAKRYGADIRALIEQNRPARE